MRAEKEEMPHHSELFNDVYDQLPSHLQEQQAELTAHMQRHPQHFNL